MPDPDGTGPQAAPVTTYGRNLGGKVISITDPVGNVTSYAYNNAGQVTVTTDPNGNSTYTSYNGAREVTGITDRDGRKRVFTYNDLGEKTSELWLGTSTGTARAGGADHGMDLR